MVFALLDERINPLLHVVVLLLNFIHLSQRHDVAEVAGLASFSFGEDEESRYVMLFKKVSTFLIQRSMFLLEVTC